VCIVGAAWGVYELVSGAYDLYKAVRTLGDPNSSAREKGITIGLAAISLFGPGGGYTGAAGLATKAAAREVAENLGLQGAQRAGVRSAISRATSKESIDVIKQESGDVTVRLTRPGRDGRQVVESTVRPDGSKSVVQRAYDASGKQVHDHPKTP
jgi:hypothetical protein